MRPAFCHVLYLLLRLEMMDRVTRLKRLRFRAWHRGTREADLMIGGFFDAQVQSWSDADLDWFEAMLEEQDVDIVAWGIKTATVPHQWNGPMMEAFQNFDFIKLPS